MCSRSVLHFLSTCTLVVQHCRSPTSTGPTRRPTTRWTSLEGSTLSRLGSHELHRLLLPHYTGAHESAYKQWYNPHGYIAWMVEGPMHFVFRFVDTNHYCSHRAMIHPSTRTSCTSPTCIWITLSSIRRTGNSLQRPAGDLPHMCYSFTHTMKPDSSIPRRITGKTWPMYSEDT